MDRRVLAWLLVAGLVLGSCTTPACSSRLLADRAGGDAKLRRIAGEGYNGDEKAASRRSLGRQMAPSPPSPQPNKKTAYVAPGSPPPLV